MLEERIWITIQIFNGLSFLHQYHLVHRDLNPRNGFSLVSSSSYNPALYSLQAKFGRSEILESHMKAPPRTHRQCTMLEEPPIIELLDDHAVYTTKVDIWGVGCILFEMFTTFAGDWDSREFTTSGKELFTTQLPLRGLLNWKIQLVQQTMVRTKNYHLIIKTISDPHYP